MKIEIGAYEAKTRLAELLQQVKTGKQFTITNRGKAIADLIPVKGARKQNRQQAVKQFHAFLEQHPLKTSVKVRDLIAEGRM